MPLKKNTTSEQIRAKTEQARGVVDINYFESHFDFHLFYPRPNLADFVDQYWTLSWELGDNKTHTQDVIPHPAVHLSFVKGESKIQGILTSKYSHTLRGNGRIFGVKFKPAGFYPFAKRNGLSLKKMVDNHIEIDRVFDINPVEVEKNLLSLRRHEDQIEYIEDTFFSKIPDLEPNIAFLNEVVRTLESNEELMRVSSLCEHLEIGKRQLQRLFSKYIGVSPKWVIRRYRLHDALARLEEGSRILGAELANELGYYDQAHFIKDVKQFFGKAPSQMRPKSIPTGLRPKQSMPQILKRISESDTD